MTSPPPTNFGAFAPPPPRQVVMHITEGMVVEPTSDEYRNKVVEMAAQNGREPGNIPDYFVSIKGDIMNFRLKPGQEAHGNWGLSAPYDVTEGRKMFHFFKGLAAFLGLSHISNPEQVNALILDKYILFEEEVRKSGSRGFELRVFVPKQWLTKEEAEDYRPLADATAPEAPAAAAPAMDGNSNEDIVLEFIADNGPSSFEALATEARTTWKNNPPLFNGIRKRTLLQRLVNAGKLVEKDDIFSLP